MINIVRISTIQENYKSQAEITYSYANFRVCLLTERTSSKQDLDKLVTNIPQLIEYGDFCQILTPIKCIFEELLSFGSVR